MGGRTDGREEGREDERKFNLDKLQHCCAPELGSKFKAHYKSDCPIRQIDTEPCIYKLILPTKLLIANLIVSSIKPAHVQLWTRDIIKSQKYP